MSVVVIAVVLTALVFDFTNGFHDTANAMATSIATGALRPRVAVLLAGVLNLVGAFLSVQVALTISSGLVDEARITPEVIFGGLVGAILWNLLTWLLRAALELLARPVRRADRRDLGVRRIGSDQLLDRGGQGAGAAGAVPDRGRRGRPDRHPASRTASPRAATSAPSTRGFRRGAGRVGLDGRAGARHQRRAEDDGRDHPDADHRRACCRRTPRRRCGWSSPPGWPSRLGTAMGGWRIIRTLGRRISDIESPQGFAAETASTAVILSSAHLGFALSTTQVTTGAVLGAATGRHAGRRALAGGGADGGRLAAHPAGRGDSRRRWPPGSPPAARRAPCSSPPCGRHRRRHLRPVPAQAGHAPAPSTTCRPRARSRSPRGRGLRGEAPHDHPLGTAARRVRGVVGLDGRGCRPGHPGAARVVAPGRPCRRHGHQRCSIFDRATLSPISTGDTSRRRTAAEPSPGAAPRRHARSNPCVVCQDASLCERRLVVCGCSID